MSLSRRLARLARANGPVMRLRLGLTTAVVASSRDAAREAFATHERRLASHAVPDTASALGFSERSVIWLPSSDPRWKSPRGTVAAHVFSQRGLAAARGLVSHVRGHGTPGARWTSARSCSMLKVRSPGRIPTSTSIISGSS
ncbi:hypothetical protein C2845_PM13G19670 [Panicum miliaceum]|uniref:Uncharacterized protein n=1 Tax=Panicum miliaceum TaxID=4540 RepID=A0A3L6RGR3_PANMI|nr:hypothetical protein C2845_PM13G19670 [Panicum miliaceum]